MRRRMVIKTPEGGLERLYSVVSGGMLAYPRNPTGLYRWLMSSRLKLLLLCTFAIMFTFFSYDTVKRKVPRRIIRCSDSASQLFLQELCDNYTKGLASGSFCHPLCSGQVIYKQCLGHGITPHVLKASWKGNDIILKVKKVLDKNLTLNASLTESNQFDRNYFNVNTNQSYVQYILDEKGINMEILDYMYSECAGHDDGILSYQKMWYCQALLAGEFLLSILLKDSQNVPKLYGTCGHVFAVEDVPDEMLEGKFLDKRPWTTKVKLALALLDMVERLDNTPYGTLYMCDIKSENFGVLTTDSGYLIKPIDLDFSWLSSQMKQVMVKESEKWCTKDSECGFKACRSKCDHWTRHCDPDFYTNNLINICRLIFTTNARIFKFGLFDQGVPRNIQVRLSLLLQDCSTPSSEPSPPTSSSMIRDLRQILHDSINLT